MDDIGYVLTNMGIYKYDNGQFKNVDVVYFSDIIGIDNVKHIQDGIVIRSSVKSIRLAYFDDLSDWYQVIVKRIQDNN